MAEYEMFDSLSDLVADYTLTTLSVKPQRTLMEAIEKNQIIHLFDDGSERVISLDDDCTFFVTLGWTTGIKKADVYTIFDFFTDVAKANGQARSFYWAHPEDTHTYTVKFRSKLSRNWASGKSLSGYLEIPQITLKVLGRKAGT
jgi:hypothetical protein